MRFKNAFPIFRLFKFLVWDKTGHMRPSETIRAPFTGIFYQNENIFEN